MEFVNLNDEIEVVDLDPTSITNIEPGDTILDGKIDDILDIPTEPNSIEIDKIEIDKEPEEDHICVKPEGDASLNYGSPRPEDKAFLLDNLFSELTTDYLREVARLNLGIATKYALIWGNITGNLFNQKDLIKFVQDILDVDINGIIDELNIKLSLWAYEINQELKNKADIDSPKFKGIPTVPTPLLLDNSDLIPTTEWVNSVIDNTLGSRNIKYFTVTPNSIYLGETTPEVVVKWDYKNSVLLLWINDVELDNSITEYKFQNLSESKYFVLKYKLNDEIFQYTISFDVLLPIYYGISEEYTECNKTSDYRIYLNARENEYIYIISPGKLRFFVSGIEGGIRLIKSATIHNHNYYIYRSDYSGLGKTYIDMLNDNFKLKQPKYLA